MKDKTTIMMAISLMLEELDCTEDVELFELRKKAIQEFIDYQIAISEAEQ